MKLKDFVNPKKNIRNFQESLDIKKLKLKEFGLTTNDLLNISIDKKMKGGSHGI